jgi:hypothetical protein
VSDLGNPEESSATYLTYEIRMLNDARISAWKSIFMATGFCAIVAVVYIFSKSLIWTGGLLLAATWVWRSIGSLRVANAAISAEEVRSGKALKEPLPIWIIMGLVLGAPLTVILGAIAFNTYDPTLFGQGSTSADSSAYDSSSTEPTVVKTFDLTEQELSDSGLTWSLGLEVWVPSVCNELTIYWHTEDQDGNSYTNFSDKYSNLTLGETNRLYMGTNEALAEPEKFFVPDSAQCM